MFDHIHIRDYSEDDINATWFRPHELRQMKSQLQQLIPQLEQRLKHRDMTEQDFLAMRGLESRTTQGGMKRAYHKREAYAAVIEEQERQWRSGREDPERIAANYQVVAVKCQGYALLQGIQDEHDVREFIASSSPSSSSNSASTESTSPIKPYEAELYAGRLAVLDDIKILSGASELAFWYTNPAAA